MIDTMHLFVTSRCTNNCPFCCNNNYNIEDVLIPSEEELSSVSTVCLTGGDPFLLGGQLNKIVNALRSRKNIKNIYVFTSGYACLKYIREYKCFPDINGITFSPKSSIDYDALWTMLDFYRCKFSKLKSNRLYMFINKYDDCNYIIDNNYLYLLAELNEYLHCEVFFRTWVENFDSPENEIFRRLENYD